MTFKRKIYTDLLTWKNESKGQTAILIEGVRRVGKSTIAMEFGKNEYQSYILINFANANKEIKELFDDISDLDYFFLQLQLQTKTTLHLRNSLIIFDEVQLFPKARQAIKHLVADGRYDYLETGSLISIKRNVDNILIPSEECKIQMNPMDYEEFLLAVGDNNTFNLLKELYKTNRPIGDATNRTLMKRFRLYMIVGGMPQAVSKYLETNNLQEVDKVKRNILSLYEDDLRKIDKNGTLSAIFRAIPSQLNKNAKGFKLKSAINSYKKSKNILINNIFELCDSKIVNIANHCNDPNVGLSSAIDIDNFKLYLVDTGLFITMQYMDKDFTENIIYEKLLNDKLSDNLGYIYQNMVAQIIHSKGETLFYYTFKKEDGKSNYEIDFIITRKNKICPLEVKSSNYRTHPSLDRFYDKYSKRILNRYIIHTKDISKDKDIFCLPIYLLYFI